MDVLVFPRNIVSVTLVSLSVKKHSTLGAVDDVVAACVTTEYT